MIPLLFGSLAAASSAAPAITFSALDLPGSQLTALSADGCVAAGGVHGGQHGGFRWSAARGAEPLPAALSVHALSPRGDYVAGSTFDSMQREVASYWDAAGKPHRLDAMPGLATIGTISQAHAIADGPRIVGSARRNDDVRVAFEWAAAGGMRALAHRGGEEARAIAISADGRLVDGWEREGERVRPLHWRDGRLLPATEAESEQTFEGDHDAGLFSGRPIGHGGGSAIRRATNAHPLPADASVRLRASSEDGSLRVGDSGNGDERAAWIWSATEGSVSLRDWLARHGSPLPPDWRPLALTAVSADGKRLGGWGRRGNDRLDSFVVDLGGAACSDRRHVHAMP